MLRALVYALAFACTLPLAAQYRATPPSSVLLHDLRKLQDVSSALYVAAHPDDENTRLIAYLANEELAETAYLSLTRGDGGQNLVGTDIREGLGVIRTQELLAARGIDGGKQFFTRANDFGYSKHPDETLTFWNRDSILSDMVWVIRKWQPDVIITRFDPESAGRTHGHHTTSAMLAVEAFELAADPTAFPEHLRHGVMPWQATRILFNTSWWFYGGREAFEAADKSDLFTVDAGPYYPLLGLSNGEIAARSRSQHASQGFGSSASRGSEFEYLKFLDGQDAEDHTDLFASINDSWSRVPGGAVIQEVLAKAEQEFNVRNPSTAVPSLLQAENLMRALPPSRYTNTKLPALRQLIADCLGIYFEAVATDTLATPGEVLTVNYEVISREANIPVRVSQLSINGTPVKLDSMLTANADVTGEASTTVTLNSSNPYWLAPGASIGMYQAPGFDLRGAPENPSPLNASALVEIGGTTIVLNTPVLYKRTYPDRGEVYRPLLVVPAAGVHFTEPVYLWPTEQAKAITVEVTSFDGKLEGDVVLRVPQGWQVEPRVIPVELSGTGAVQTVSFAVTPNAASEGGELGAIFSADGRSYDRDVNILRYAHIPQQAMIGAASAKAVRLELKRAGKRIGYIMGAGDVVPKALQEVGYEVDLLNETDLMSGKLQKYDAIVLGVRAYNTQDWLQRHNDKLLAYAKTGGTVVVQYNTNRGLDMNDYAPYPLKLSRNRVTVEEAPVSFIDPQARVLTTPNKLGPADFEGWVQERGLYFPEEWDEAYQPILVSNDPGEEPLEGGLLVAEYGKGHYVYTGLSFFRELPAGVPGAYRLFVNLLEL